MLRDPSLIPLSRQHHNGLALCLLTERSLAEDESAGTLAALAKRISDRYEVELTNHFSIEEEILFPACPASLSGLVGELIGEHRMLEKLVGEIRSEPTAGLIREFTDLLRRHIRREERDLFERIPKLVRPEVLKNLGRQINEKAVQVCL